MKNFQLFMSARGRAVSAPRARTRRARARGAAAPPGRGAAGPRLRHVGQAANDELQRAVRGAHTAEHEHLLAHQAARLAQLRGGLQRVRLAGDQEGHQARRLVVRIQLHLRPAGRALFTGQV